MGWTIFWESICIFNLVLLGTKITLRLILMRVMAIKSLGNNDISKYCTHDCVPLFESFKPFHASVCFLTHLWHVFSMRMDWKNWENLAKYRNKRNAFSKIIAFHCYNEAWTFRKGVHSHEYETKLRRCSPSSLLPWLS